jgi:MYXO-CTERM domain-containing protein
MKKLLLTAAAILATLNIYGQGSGIVNFASVGQPDARRIWVNNTGVVGDGAKADNRYVAALYFAAPGTSVDALFTQVGGSTPFLSTATTTGTINGGGRTITGPGISNGGTIAFQVRAWELADGATYEEALLNPQGNVGKGAIFEADTKDPSIPTEQPPTLGAAAGWNGFAVTPVPEPSVIGLGLLGVGTLLMLRRRK